MGKLIDSFNLNSLDSIIFDHAPGPILVLDKHQRIVKANRYTVEELGYTQEELMCMRLPDIEGFSETWLHETPDARIERPLELQPEVLCKRKDESRLWLSISKNVVQRGNSHFYILYCRNISRQKQDEKIIRENEAQLQVATKIAKLGYWEYDNSSDTLRLNDQFFRIFKTSIEEVGSYEMNLERYTELFLPPEELELISRETERGYRDPSTKYHRYLEHQANYWDGTPAWMGVHFIMVKDEEGTDFKTIGVTQDITERKKTERMLRQNEISLDKAFKIAAIGPCSYDFVNDRILWTSRALHVIGLSEDEAPTDRKSFLEMVHSDDLSGALKAYEKIAESPRIDIELRTVIKGQVKYFRFKSNLEFDEEGRPVQAIGIIQDITERKLAEAELEKYRDHLEQLVQERTRQLESINKDLEAFAYSISHDLRAPIRHINGFTNLLNRQIQTDNVDTRNYLELIIAASRRMGDMIDALLNFSRLGRQELIKSEIDLNTLVREVIRNFEPDFKHRSIEWKLSTLPTVSGDQGLLKIAFENLISNAIKYTQPRREAVIEIGQPTDHCNGIFVRDNGVGFDGGYDNKLFGVFQRLHRDEDFDGTGIGLANVQQIIKKHGWSIRAEGEVGRGATFYIKM
ncbi:PAS domain-containing sensor histidine kinase [Flavilitoribacter nigricans]|uniref:histidine kinase n=1 Tax=Flavilitoribacter nigricans (strain ATCC 23147 / DSM 23189 / NBRC 102662 / NCIMB 1420 / SS-2) TaxID=1122177 RepID=A0A2D0NF40_FLAN2|nr:PAS domain-containing sensor histidine kinase [Flavilitoribacter nigricans]PHN07134.1 hypothetical protein CRP01_07855 [Flavilitoribacter nigricans DSM 23189 = NBRC 102662]